LLKKQEEFIDPKTGKKVTVQKKVFKDKDGNVSKLEKLI